MGDIFTGCGWKCNTDKYSSEIENIDMSLLIGRH